MKGKLLSFLPRPKDGGGGWRARQRVTDGGGVRARQRATEGACAIGGGARRTYDAQSTFPVAPENSRKNPTRHEAEFRPTKYPAGSSLSPCYNPAKRKQKGPL